MTLPDQLDDDPQLLAEYTAELDACATMDDVDAVLGQLREAGAWPRLIDDLRLEQEQWRGTNVIRVEFGGHRG